MRAYVHQADSDGKAIIGTGRITGEYKSEATLLRYGVQPLRRAHYSLRVAIYHNWDRRYGEPDKVIVL